MVLIILIMLIIQVSSIKEYNYFEQLWPETYCMQYKCHLHDRNYVNYFYPQKWNIHGLFPAQNVHSRCSLIENERKYAQKFDYDAFDDALKVGLNQAMMGKTTKTIDFIKNQWSKHGTCWHNPNMHNDQITLIEKECNQVDYFQTLLRLWQTYDFEKTLWRCGIIPDKWKHYQIKHIETCLQHEYGIKFTLSCYSPPNQHPKQYLKGISFCVDQKGNAIYCTCNRMKMCSRSTIIYPPFEV